MSIRSKHKRQARELREHLCYELDNPEQYGYKHPLTALKEDLLYVLDHGEYQDPNGFALNDTMIEYLRGKLVLLLYLANVPSEIYRPVFSHVWHDDWHQVVDAAGSRRRLRTMFERAHLPPPGEWPDTIRIWRGSRNKPELIVAKGFSWTTNRDVACKFAMQDILEFGFEEEPLVLAADVPKSSIAFYYKDWNEGEVVCFDVKNWFIDGDCADWTEGCKRQIAKDNAFFADPDIVPE